MHNLFDWLEPEAQFADSHFTELRQNTKMRYRFKRCRFFTEKFADTFHDSPSLPFFAPCQCSLRHKWMLLSLKEFHFFVPSNSQDKLNVSCERNEIFFCELVSVFWTGVRISHSIMSNLFFVSIGRIPIFGRSPWNENHPFTHTQNILVWPGIVNSWNMSHLCQRMRIEHVTLPTGCLSSLINRKRVQHYSKSKP